MITISDIEGDWVYEDSDVRCNGPDNTIVKPQYMCVRSPDLWIDFMQTRKWIGRFTFVPSVFSVPYKIRLDTDGTLSAGPRGKELEVVVRLEIHNRDSFKLYRAEKVFEFFRLSFSQLPKWYEEQLNRRMKQIRKTETER